MNKLIKLELKRNSLKTYHLATLIIAIVMLGFVFLMAAIPRIEPNDNDAELFSSYDFVIGLTIAVLMGVFSIMSAVMSSKFIVDEYIGKKVILLFSYPISRDRILKTKILMVFCYTLFSMLISGLAILFVFFITESLLNINPDTISIQVIAKSIFNLLCCSIISSSCGIISLWFGFMRKSVVATIIASCIIMVIVCQLVTMTFFSSVLLILIPLAIGFFSVLSIFDLCNKVNKLEI